MKYLKNFNESSQEINPDDIIVTDLSANGPSGSRSPFHNIKGVVKKIQERANKTDYLIDLSMNGPEFLKKHKDSLYSERSNSVGHTYDLGGTCKWFENTPGNNQVIKL